MHKKLKHILEERGLTVYGKSAYGFMRDYETNFVFGYMRYMTVVAQIDIAFYGTDECRRSIDQQLCWAMLKHCTFTFTSYGITLHLCYTFLRSLIADLPVLFDKVCDILSSSGAGNRNVCPKCGKPLLAATSRICKIDDINVTLDTDCIEGINAKIETRIEEFSNSPNNYGRGFLGAFIGALTGVPIAALLYVVGFVSGFAMVVSSPMSAWLYRKFKGKINMAMIAIVTSSSIVVMMLCIIIIYALSAAEKTVGLSVFEAFGWLMYVSPDFRNKFIIDAVAILIFAASYVPIMFGYVKLRADRRKKI